MELVYFRNEKTTYFRFRYRIRINSRICITDTDMEESDAETVVIFRILYRICTRKKHINRSDFMLYSQHRIQ